MTSSKKPKKPKGKVDISVGLEGDADALPDLEFDSKGNLLKARGKKTKRPVK